MQPAKVTQSLLWTLSLTLVILASATACAQEPRDQAQEPVTPAENASAEAGQPEEAPAGVVNYTRVNATVACAGATAPEAIPELKRRGFVSIINFRRASERGANVEASQAAARDTGLRYFHIPFGSPSAEATEEFLEIVADPANQPVYIHCGSANRVGAMWLIKRVKLDGWDVDEATAEAEAIGLRSPALKEFALAYVKSDGP